ncbi:hypothetical protein J9978_02615 [Chromobacterium violaceum]|uniref:hypothetical protein n=1 Tax=Chromobacterium violaceum TaxID=536 RepID=UPI00111C161D|nr:hypothetical protein [Chromobacterium violaceum]MBP4048392.1 hypothetical protein [Chromobacterium violaceum]
MSQSFQLVFDSSLLDTLSYETQNISLSIRIGDRKISDIQICKNTVSSISTHSAFFSVTSAHQENGGHQINFEPSTGWDQADILKSMHAPWRSFPVQNQEKSSFQHIALSGASGDNF